MSDIERLSIALPAPMAETIRNAVNAGEYASASEVVRDALRLWQTRQQLREQDIAVLRERWNAGKASGIAGDFDIERVISSAKSKLEQAGE